MATKFKVRIYRGDDVTLPDSILGSGNLSGTFVFTIKRNKQETAGILTKSTLVNQGITLDGPSRTLTISLSSGPDTSILLPGIYVCDVKRIDSGSEAVLSDGILIVSQPVGHIFSL